MATSTNLAVTLGRSKSKLGADHDQLVNLLDHALAGKVTVTFSATPVFNAALGNIYEITLTAAVTSSTITNPQFVGQAITFKIIEDGTGGRTFAFPANVKGATAITTTANRVNVQEFQWDGTNWISLGTGQNF
jgi:hypothetical protein